jgi:hypothetical protein
VPVSAVNPWEWSNHTLDVLIALGTTGAVIVALGISVGGGLVRSFRDWRRRPLLTLTHDPKTHVRREMIKWRGKPKSIGAGYVRLAVTNPPGRRAAEDVEVLVEAIRAIAPPPGVEDEWIGEGWTVRDFGPLIWTHDAPPALRIGPGVSRTVDLGFLYADDEDVTYQRFMMGLKTTSGSMIDQLHAGSYDITLVVTGSNCDARRFRVGFEFGLWTPFEADEEQLRITAVEPVDAPPPNPGSEAEARKPEATPTEARNESPEEES